MRVIAGKAKSLRLKTIEGLDTRPTQDRIKETLFNMINNSLPNATFVDLFSGSGAIGIEAISRNAKHAYFVEKNRDACKCIKENLEFTKLVNNATVLNLDVFTALGKINEKNVDVIFMDPPYNKELEKEVLKKLHETTLVGPDTLIIVEASLETEFEYLYEYGYELVKVKEYKTNKHVFISVREDYTS